MNYFGWFIALSMKIEFFQQMLSKHFCTVNEVHCRFVSIKNTYMSSYSFTVSIDLSTARPKWRLDGPALSDHLLYAPVNHAFAKRYHYHLVR